MKKLSKIFSCIGYLPYIPIIGLALIYIGLEYVHNHIKPRGPLFRMS